MLKNKYINDYRISDNLLHNQNYVLSDRVKFTTLIEYFHRRDSLFFPLNIIFHFLNK